MKKSNKQNILNPPLGTSSPQWVIDMRLYYAQTGNYRGDDLVRVLGKPSESVSPPEKNKDDPANLPFKIRT